jgi:hypothetical protein
MAYATEVRAPRAKMHCYKVIRTIGTQFSVQRYTVTKSYATEVCRLRHSGTLSYTVKKRFASFPSPAGMSIPNSPWAGIMTS